MASLLFPLVQWIVTVYFIVNLMVLGALLTVRLALTIAHASGELKKQREEAYQRHIMLPGSLPGPYDKAWRQQRRWELLNGRPETRRRKGGKPWM
jgi:hypothetical protein